MRSRASRRVQRPRRAARAAATSSISSFNSALISKATSRRPLARARAERLRPSGRLRFPIVVLLKSDAVVMASRLVLPQPHAGVTNAGVVMQLGAGQFTSLHKDFQSGEMLATPVVLKA